MIADRYASVRGLVRLALAHLESAAGSIRSFQEVDFQSVDRLVFVCLGNICRSPFAEYVARSYGVATAGFGLSTTTGAPAFELAQRAAHTFGIDMSQHHAVDFQDFQVRDSDLLLVMEVRHARRLQAMLAGRSAQIALLGNWAAPRRLHIHDPLEHSEQYFQNCFTVIRNATQNLVEQYLQARSLEDSQRGQRLTDE